MIRFSKTKRIITFCILQISNIWFNRIQQKSLIYFYILYINIYNAGWSMWGKSELTKIYHWKRKHLADLQKGFKDFQVPLNTLEKWFIYSVEDLSAEALKSDRPLTWVQTNLICLAVCPRTIYLNNKPQLLSQWKECNHSSIMGVVVKIKLLELWNA